MQTGHAQEVATVSIAIDGPVASGKSVVGRRVAERLGFRFLDTGMMYRAVTWAALRQGASLNDVQALGTLAQQTSARESPGHAATLMRFFVGETDVTDSLRTPEVERSVSIVSQVADVREALVQRQRAVAERQNVVVVGRDIGTVVLPDATLKVFLTASPEVRARRRHEELRQADSQASYSAVLEETKRRDKLDSERTLSPLKPAPDAVILNTDGLAIEGVIDRILIEFQRKTGHAR